MFIAFLGLFGSDMWEDQRLPTTGTWRMNYKRYYEFFMYVQSVQVKRAIVEGTADDYSAERKGTF